LVLGTQGGPGEERKWIVKWQLLARAGPPSLFVALALACPAQVARGAENQRSNGERLRAPKEAEVKAEITLHVPASAKVWFDGESTSQTGTKRVFTAPALPAGREYTYEVKVEWGKGTNRMQRSGHLAFRAGERVTLSFVKGRFIEVRGPDDNSAAAAREGRVRRSSQRRSAAPRRWAPAPRRDYYAPPTSRPRFYSPDNYPEPGGPPQPPGGGGVGDG